LDCTPELRKAAEEVNKNHEDKINVRMYEAINGETKDEFNDKIVTKVNGLLDHEFYIEELRK